MGVSLKKKGWSKRMGRNVKGQTKHQRKRKEGSFTWKRFQNGWMSPSASFQIRAKPQCHCGPFVSFTSRLDYLMNHQFFSASKIFFPFKKSCSHGHISNSYHHLMYYVMKFLITDLTSLLSSEPVLLLFANASL